jgi:hypothetical protein
MFPLLGLVIIGLGFMNLLAPQTVWRYTEAWKYKNPDANEPSEIMFGFQRVSGALMVGAGIWVMTGLP